MPLAISCVYCDPKSSISILSFIFNTHTPKRGFYLLPASRLHVVAGKLVVIKNIFSPAAFTNEDNPLSEAEGF